MRTRSPLLPSAAALLVLACLVPAFASLGCGRSAPRHIVLVSVDTLRADHMSLYGYPRETTPQLERWFAQAAVYERAYSTEAATSPSVASFLTGLLPQEHRVRLLHQLLPEGVPLVTELLPAAYEKAAIVSNAVLSDEAMGLASRFDHYDDRVDEPESERQVWERRASRTTDAALQWVATRADPARPLFLWVHYIDPHGPYDAPPEWPRRFEHDPAEAVPVDLERMVQEYILMPGVEDARVYVDAYDEEIAYTDAEIGRLLDGLEGAMGLDGALVLFTADHGESLMDHNYWFTHAYHVYEEIVHVPLLVRGPGVPSVRSEVTVSGVDVAPTLLRFAGVELPASMRGADLTRPERIDPSRIVYVEATQDEGQMRAAIRGRRKAVLALAGPQREVLGAWTHDLERDPDELERNAPEREAALGRALMAMAERDPDPAGIPTEYREGVKLSGPKVAPTVDGRSLERLRALGYVP